MKLTFQITTDIDAQQAVRVANALQLAIAPTPPEGRTKADMERAFFRTLAKVPGEIVNSTMAAVTTEADGLPALTVSNNRFVPGHLLIKVLAKAGSVEETDEKAPTGAAPAPTA